MLSADEAVLLARRLGACSDCGKRVILCDNGLRLDPEPDDVGLWALFNVGGAVWAASADDEGSRHNLHEHQAVSVQ